MCNVSYSLLVMGKMWLEWLLQNVQYHSLPVGCRTRCYEGCLAKLHIIWNVTHLLLTMEMRWNSLSQNLQCHSHPAIMIGNRKRCDEVPIHICIVQCHLPADHHRKRYDNTAFHKICSVTHFLLVMGKYVMWPDCLSENVQCLSHLLLIIGTDMMRLPFTQYMQCHSLAIGHGKRCDEIAFHNCETSFTCYWSKEMMWDETAFDKMCNVTCFLVIIGKDVISLCITRCAMSLACCWSYEKMALHKCSMALTNCYS